MSTYEELLKTIAAFIKANSWEDAKCIMKQHPELLTEDVDDWLEIYAETDVFSRIQFEGRGRQVIEHRRALLADCMEVGAEQAFAEQGSATVPRHRLTSIAHLRGAQRAAAQLRAIITPARHRRSA